MKRLRLLLVEDSQDLRAWLDSVSASGVRYGWLHPRSAAVAEELAARGDGSALRTVHLTSSGSVAVKPRKRPAPLRDLLREHFLGCQLVLIERDPTTPIENAECQWLQACGQEVVRLLAPGAALGGQDDRAPEWQVRSLSGDLVLSGDGERLCRALRQPRWLPATED